MKIVFVDDEDFLPELEPGVIYVYKNSLDRYAIVRVSTHHGPGTVHPLPPELDTDEAVRGYLFRQKLEESI